MQSEEMAELKRARDEYVRRNIESNRELDEARVKFNQAKLEYADARIKRKEFTTEWKAVNARYREARRAALR